MTMRSYIELYIHINDTNPGEKSLRMSVKSPPPHQKKKKKGSGNLIERTRTQGRV